MADGPSSSHEIVVLIRSILTSRKGAATLKEIRADYEAIAGRLNMKDTNLDALLRNFRSEFIWFERDGVKYYNAKPKESSEHVNRLVGLSQTKSKKKVPMPRRFHNNSRPATQNASTTYNRMWNSDAAQRARQMQYQMRPTRTVTKYSNNNNNVNLNNNVSSYKNLNIVVEQKLPKKPETERKLSETDLRHKLQSQPSISKDYATQRQQTVKPQPAEKAPEKQQQQTTRYVTFNDPQVLRQITNTQSTGCIPKSTLQNRIINQQLPELLPKLQISSLTNRLTKNREINPEDLKAAREYELRSSAGNTPTTPYHWDLDTIDDIKKLENYCIMNGFKPPLVSNCKTKYTDEMDLKVKFHYNACITINEKSFSNYPESFLSKEEALQAVAAYAVQELRKEEQLQKYPIDLDFDYEIAKKLHSMLRSNPDGVIKKSVPTFYRETYQKSLPEHWFQIMCENNGKLFDLNETEIAQIIYALPDDGSSVSSETEDTIVLPELELPWNSENWDLYVLNPTKTDQVYVRLIGPEWSEKMDALLDEIEMKFVESKPIIPSDIKLNRIYLCAVSDCWHRARVMEINEADKEANVFLIDQADYEVIPLNELYVCPPEFMKLPAQAFSIWLYGLEDFVQNPNSGNHLEELLRWKSLIGKVITGKDKYNPTEGIKVILYDTSGDDDVNLNEMILDKILSSTPMPSFQAKIMNDINITYVDDFIYCQLDQSYKYITGLINNIVRFNFNKEEHQGLYPETANNLKRFYLVHDLKRNNWFRGQILKSNTTKTAFKVCYVDAGIIEDVELSNIYRLDKISIALARYPAQVIKFKLYRVEMSEENKSKLRAWLPFGKDAMAKVVSIANGIPYVHLTIYLRVNDQPILLKINEQLNMEVEAVKNGIGNSNGTYSNNGDLSENQFDSKHLSKGLIKLEQCKLKNNGEFIKVHLTLVSSPQCFVIQLYDNLVPLNEMMAELQLYCQSRRNDVLPLDMIIKGEVYATFNDEDNRWYRASVENISYNIIHVFLVDYGSFKTLSNDKMRMLPDKYRMLPKQAMKAKLHGVKPVFGDYSPNDAFYFIQLTKNKTFPGVVKNISADHFSSEPVYEVVLFDNDHKINDLLIKENRALAD